jgi:hypothetical protein
MDVAGPNLKIISKFSAGFECIVIKSAKKNVGKHRSYRR